MIFVLFELALVALAFLITRYYFMSLSVNVHERIDRKIEIESDVDAELCKALTSYPAFNSAHEGYAVMLEEVEELWAEVRTNAKHRNIETMRAEAIQIAAMAMRFALDCCTVNGKGYGK